jgi:hypothetical protein
LLESELWLVYARILPHKLASGIENSKIYWSGSRSRQVDPTTQAFDHL